MTRAKLAVLMGATCALMAWPLGVALAQPVTAEVRTRSGQSLRLTDPSLHVVYNVVPYPIPAPDGGAQQQPYGAAPPPEQAAPRPQGGLSISIAPPGGTARGAPELPYGVRARDSIRLRQGDVDVVVPLDGIQTLALARRPVTGSTLPPYVAPAHARYSAAVVLIDGTRMDGEYVNLGTTYLRGATAHGRAEVAWEDVETVRFVR